MRCSIWCSTSTPWPDLLARAAAVEAHGFHGFWVADHFMPNQGDHDEPMLECFAVLAGVAARVDRLRLGSLVAGNTYRHPAVLANQAATIDHISGGRLVLGLGAGWQEDEHQAYGIDLGTRPERIAWFTEACEVIRGLRDQRRTSFDGSRYQLRDAPMEPKPAGPMPLLIGSSGPRMAAVVARFADEWNTWGTPDGFAAKAQHVSRALDEAGRDPASLVRSTQALVFLGPDGATRAAQLQAIRPAIGGPADQLLEQLAAYAEHGVDEFIVPDFTLGSQTEALEAIERLAVEVLAHL